ncbi:hypothetical protein ACFLZC_00230 [Patescibacteria group bacterium]
MNEQNIPQSNGPVQSSKHIWITIIAVIVTAVVVGGGVYVWQKSSLQSVEQSNEITKIIQKISVYCEKYNISECLPVTSYFVVDLDDKHSVVKIGGFNYLLTKKDNEWNVSIVSQENNICETGSDSSDLVEYCSR